MEIIWSNELFNRIDQIIDGDKIILNFLNNPKRQLGKTNKFQLFRNYLHTRTLVGLFKNIIKIYTHTYIKISWIFFFFCLQKMRIVAFNIVVRLLLMMRRNLQNRNTEKTLQRVQYPPKVKLER